MTYLHTLPTRANPESSPETLGTDENTIGWEKGKISDGCPYWAECWAQDGITMLTIYHCSDGLKFGDDHSLQDFLEKEGLISFRDKCLITPCWFLGYHGNFWSINIIVGDEDEVYCDSQISIFPYGSVSTAN
jgi:hypothetical protein